MIKLWIMERYNYYYLGVIILAEIMLTAMFLCISMYKKENFKIYL